MQRETKQKRTVRSSRVAGVECNIAAPIKPTDGGEVILFPQWVAFKTQACNKVDTIKLNME